MKEIKRKIDKLIINACYVALISIFLLACLEVGTRIFSSHTGKSVLDVHNNRENMQAYSYYDWKTNYFTDLRKLPSKGTLVYEPFSLWKTVDLDTSLINIKDGYRHTWNHVSSEEATKNIFFFGGSTIFCMDSPDTLTIPSVFSKMLFESDNQDKYFISNYSASGFVLDNEIHLLVDLIKSGKIPDIAIFYDGANEVGNKVFSGVPHYYYPEYTLVTKKYSIQHFLSKLASKFAIIRLLKRHREQSINRGILANRASHMIEEYKENIEFINHLADQYNFQAFFFWQPNIFTVKKVTTNEEILIKKNPPSH